MSEQRVKDYYAPRVRQEWNRLVKDAYHRLELETTLHFLEKYLPPRGRILDAGGGPGRYTYELASRGYDLVMLDLVPAHIAFARRQIKRFGLQGRVEDIAEGNILDLSRFADGSFDAVICLGGPLSHIRKITGRDHAIDELIRVAKKGAPIFASVMSRLSVIVVELELFPEEFGMPFYKPMRNTGDYAGLHGFTTCHFFLPEEFRLAFETKPVEVLEMVGLEGLGSHHPRKVNQLAKNPRLWKSWMETHYRTCTHPSVVGLSEHMLLVGKKE